MLRIDARIGQKGRTCHVWWRRGKRPPGLCDQRFTFAYIFAAVEPGTDVVSKTRLRHGVSPWCCPMRTPIRCSCSWIGFR